MIQNEAKSQLNLFTYFIPNFILNSEKWIFYLDCNKPNVNIMYLNKIWPGCWLEKLGFKNPFPFVPQTLMIL